MLFADRAQAGRFLASKLTKYADRPDLLVLALPRGGVPVAFEVAKALHAPLDVFLVRKLGLPGREELAMGAIASGGVRVLNEDVVARLAHPKRRDRDRHRGGAAGTGTARADLSRGPPAARRPRPHCHPGR
jgi:putative phosphoribosyl transferase